MTETKETELKNIQVFENYRWRKYLHNLGLARFEKFRRYYGDWLCRTWRDQEHAKFAEEFDQTTKVLKRFLKVSETQIPFLLRKAQRLEDYLQQR